MVEEEAMNYWRLVTAGLQHQWVRSFLTTVGIMIAVAAVFILFSTINGLKITVLSELSKMGSNKLIISPGSIGSMNFGGVYFTDSDVDVVERIPGVKMVLPLAATPATAECCGRKAGILLEGADPGKFSKMYEAMGAYLEDGRTLRAGDKYDALVGYSVAHDAFGKKIHAGTSIMINGERFKVVGVLKRTGGPMDTTVYIPMKTFEELTGERGKYIRIIALTANGANMDQIADRIKRALKLHRGKEDFHILTPERMQSMANQILSIIEALLVSIAAIALIVGAVGIMNTMYMSVTERTREIGV
ncbi:MAG: ABC transporter permease, partial [Candidatus Diapherotrites archaeon]|nr:ABC transporter permease [Candidatus Diapherotrites archaeon]